MSSASTEPTDNLHGQPTTPIRRLRHAPGDQRPLTEAEAIVADRLALADLEAAGCDLGPLDDREPRELDGAEVEP